MAKDKSRGKSRTLKDLMERLSEMRKDVRAYVKMAPAVLRQAKLAARELKREYAAIQSGLHRGKRKKTRRRS